MCRWLAYSGGALPLEALILRPEISLIDQSMSARMGFKPTNGDGFGVGWYGRLGMPGIYRAVQPAWNDDNLHDLCEQIESELFLAHVRRSTGTPVQQSNCHPFRRDNLLFVHNGLIREFATLKRELLLEVAPELFSEIRGSTDSELMFFLALTFGLADEPLAALERTVELIERTAKAHGVANPLQMTIGVADGSRLYSVRYSSEGDSRSLFYSKSKDSIRELYPDHPKLAEIPRDGRAVVSEPLNDLTGMWVEVPESSGVIVGGGDVEVVPFEPALG
jgi:glutamine amidotransferase